jgi:glucosamine--fructose-6-phosphate aminotransferase (isomerizing)
VEELRRHGVAARAENAHEALRDDRGEPVVCAISKSGGTREVQDYIARRRGDGPILGLINAETSPLAEACEVVLPMRAGPEAHIANKSFVCSVAVLNLLADAICRPSSDGVRPELRALAGWCSELFEDAALAGRLAALAANCTQVDILAYGPARAAALQTALVFREVLALSTAAIDTADYLHGWWKTAGPRTLTIVLSSGRAEGGAEEEALRRAAGRGSATLLVSGEGALGADLVLAHPRVADQVAPIAQFVGCSALAGALREALDAT